MLDFLGVLIFEALFLLYNWFFINVLLLLDIEFSYAKTIPYYFSFFDILDCNWEFPMFWFTNLDNCYIKNTMAFSNWSFLFSSNPFFISDVNHSFLYTFLYSASWDNWVIFFMAEKPIYWLFFIIYWILWSTELISSLIWEMLVDNCEDILEIVSSF